jgi:hypothetical protein
MEKEEIQHQILLGTILGDASISKPKGKRNYSSISWQHSYLQKEYAIWKADNSLNNYSVHERDRFDKRTNKIYSSFTCYSIKDNYINYRKLFYNDKKEVSESILNQLKPLGLAVWYMDDGNLYYNSNNCHLTLATNCFENSQFIIDWFDKNYNLKFKKTGAAIRLTSKKECEKFMKIVKNYIHPTMSYKTLEAVLLKYKEQLTPEQLKRRWKRNR